MNANQRFTLVAVVLSCMACAGTTLALVSLDDREAPSHSIVQHPDELRPSLVAAPELVRVPRPRPVMRPSRLDFLSPDVGEIEFPEAIVEAAADPDTWSVEVTEQPVTSAKQQRSKTRTKTRQTKKTKKKRYTLKQRLAEISPAALSRLRAKFEAAKAVWPPVEVAYVAIKDERVLEVYARPTDGSWTYVHRYKVLAASGARGPKLLRGDKQVPEGVYGISYLNPNSAFHVSLRVNYPNAFDRTMAKKDGRKDLGGDIMIHGKSASAGCLAMGDPSAEELFVLAAEIGRKNVTVVIAPTDFRKPQKVSIARGPNWVPELYSEIASAMVPFKAPPPQPGLLTLLGL